MHKYLLIFIFSLSGLAQVSSTTSTKRAIFLLDTEIATTKKLLEKRKSIFLKHRLFELLSEKAEKQRLSENESYFEQIKTKFDVVKESFYVNSKKIGSEANVLGESIIKEFKTYDRLGEVYLTLAFNCRDYIDDCKPEQYYLNALKYTQNDKEKQYIVVGSLADYYYNEKKYDLAIKYYSLVTQNENKESWLKYAYNYAWCLLKKERHDESFKLIFKVYNVATQTKNTAMVSVLKQQLPVFFYQTKQFDQSLVFFYKDYEKPLSESIKFARGIYKKGEFKEGERYLKKVLDNDKTEEAKIEVSLSLIEIFKETHDYKGLFSQLELLTDKKFTIDEERLYFFKDLIVNLKKEMDRRNESASKKVIVSYISSLYDFLIKFDPKERVEYTFYKGEILYSIKNFTDSLAQYGNCISYSERPTKFLDLCMEAILSIEHAKANIPILSKYLTLEPKGKFSSLLYRKLYEEFEKKNDFDSMETILFTYSNEIKSEEETQKKMYTAIIDAYLKQKNKDKVRMAAEKVTKNFLNFEVAFRNKLWEKLGNLYLDSDDSSTDDAISKINEILEYPEIPKDLKLRATLKMAETLFKKNNFDEAMLWVHNALAIKANHQVHKDFYLSFLKELNLRDDLSQIGFYVPKLINVLDHNELASDLIPIYFLNLRFNELSELKKLNISKENHTKIEKLLLNKEIKEVKADHSVSLAEKVVLKEMIKGLSNIIVWPNPFDENEFNNLVLKRIEGLTNLKNKFSTQVDNDLKIYLLTNLVLIYKNTIESFNTFKVKLPDPDMAYSIKQTLKKISSNLKKEEAKFLKTLSNAQLPITYLVFDDLIYFPKSHELSDLDYSMLKETGDNKIVIGAIKEEKYLKAIDLLEKRSLADINDKNLLINLYLKTANYTKLKSFGIDLNDIRVFNSGFNRYFKLYQKIIDKDYAGAYSMAEELEDKKLNPLMGYLSFKLEKLDRAKLLIGKSSEHELIAQINYLLNLNGELHVKN